VRLALCALALSLATATFAAEPLPAAVAAAARSPERSQEARADARRHGPVLVAMSGAEPGDRVLELIPGAGYFTRLFSLTVGPRGRVYAVWPSPYARQAVPNVEGLRATSRRAPFRNIVVQVQPTNAFGAPEPVDVVFTSQNLHDYAARFMQPTSTKLFLRRAHAALKPGGVLLVVDHAALSGRGEKDADSLHRIEAASVIRQARRVGFVLEARSGLLENANDDRRLPVFDPKIRGRTDQFVLKFRKPGSRMR
jgi:predicted methyltransferase